MRLTKDDIQLLHFTNNVALVKGKLGHLPSVTMAYKIKEWVVAQSCPALWDLWTAARHCLGILQTRNLEWVAISSSRGSSQPWWETRSRLPRYRQNFFFYCLTHHREAHIKFKAGQKIQIHDSVQPYIFRFHHLYITSIFLSINIPIWCNSIGTYQKKYLKYTYLDCVRWWCFT